MSFVNSLLKLFIILFIGGFFIAFHIEWVLLGGILYALLLINDSDRYVVTFFFILPILLFIDYSINSWFGFTLLLLFIIGGVYMVMTQVFTFNSVWKLIVLFIITLAVKVIFNIVVKYKMPIEELLYLSLQFVVGFIITKWLYKKYVK